MTLKFLGQPVENPKFVPPATAWLRHGPFAHWIVRAARPRRIVELGTHYGFSYFAFCQAVKAAELLTECFAVDTWLGDEHAGLYGEEVYNCVTLENEQYAGFSKLLRMTFSEALEHIEDGTIDLLHIDGRHFYEDIKEDFESWIPKLSNRAIVLFHDTEVRNRGFGVFQYWEELVEKFPAFNFTYQHGLGVLFFGTEFQDEIVEFIRLLKKESGSDSIHGFFMLAGENFIFESQINALTAQVPLLGADLVINDEPIAKPKDVQFLLELVRAMLSKHDKIAEKNIAMQEGEIVRGALENAALTAQLCAADEQAAALKAEVAKRTLENARLTIQLRAEQEQAAALLNSMLQAQKILRSPLQSVVRRNLAKFALKRLPIRDEGTRERLRRSIEKRELRTMLGFLDAQQRSGAGGKSTILVQGAEIKTATTNSTNAVPLALKAPSASLPGFSLKTSEEWKLALRSEMSARLVQELPLVSIVMPTKNRLGRIHNAINSVLEQSYDNWELIIVDDGSSDGTFEELPVLFPDSRISVIKSNGNGVCAARNTGICESRGEVIAYLDDDNRWHPDYLDLTLMQMLRSESSCCYSVQRRFPNGLENPEGASYLNERFDLTKLKRSNYIDLNVFAHRRSVSEELGMFDLNLRRMVDWDLIIRYCEKYPPTFCNSIGADYDNSKKPDRISVQEHISYLSVVRNKHMIDWEGLKKDLPKRELGLISIIICVYNNPELTAKCLASLLRHEAGLPFEIVLVDNGSNVETVEMLHDWAKRDSRIMLHLNHENMNFALGNNLGFAMSRGSTVVFLNNDTEVTPEWLGSLVAPLARDDIRGVQPMLVFPDGTIQCIGLVFSDFSPFAYGLYATRPGDDFLASKRRRFKALTAACLAMRANDIIEARGFDPLYVNGQEDVDLCLRIGGGEPVFTCATDAVVIHHEGKSEGRGKAIPANRAIFAERWAGKIAGDDNLHYEADCVVVESYSPDSPVLDERGLASYRPALKFSHPAGPAVHCGVNGLRFRVPCPRPSLKDRWGDYHFAVALSRAAARIGVPSRIDFLENWGDPAGRGEVDVVLRGLSVFPSPNPSLHADLAESSSKKLMWMISHPDKITDQELEGYDQIFVASDHWANELGSRSLRTEVKPLLQCTEIERFNLQARIGAPRHDRLYVANSRKILRTSLAKAIKEGITLDVYGEMWEGLAPVGWVRGENVANVELASYYAGAGVVLNDHWDTMRSHGFVSNRIFDVLATGAPLVTDSVFSMPITLREVCTVVEDDALLSEAIIEARSMRNQAERDEIARWIASEHSFGTRVRQICSSLR